MAQAAPRRVGRRAWMVAAAAAPWLAWPVRGADAPPARHAVLSLVGDRIHLIRRRQEVGSNLIDPHDRGHVSVDDSALDDAAFAGVDEAIGDAAPASERLRFSIRDPRLFAAQAAWLTAGAGSDAAVLREGIQALCRQHGASRLVLVTRRVEPTRFALRDGSTGAGRIEGLGFYRDDFTSTRDVERNQGASEGYIAVYASVQATLLDTADLRTLGSAGGSAHRLITADESPLAVRAWDAKSPAEKAAILADVLRRAARQAATGALARA